jgi:hypothetical protein
LLQDCPIADSAPHRLWFASAKNAALICELELPAGEGKVVGEDPVSISAGIKIGLFASVLEGGMPSTFSIPDSADDIVC